MDMLNLVTLAATQGPFDDGGSEWWWVGRLVVFLLWIVVISFVVRWVARSRRHDPMDRARAVLAERFARGEIDAEEYRQRSREMKS
jgi:putative membrane protein